VLIVASSYLQDRIAARSGAKIGLLSAWISVFRSSSLGDFLLASACLIEKVTVLEGLLYLTPGFETNEGFAKKMFHLNWQLNQEPSAQKPVH